MLRAPATDTAEVRGLERYEAPFPFEGTLTKLDVQLTRGAPSPGEAEAAERAALSRQ